MIRVIDVTNDSPSFDRIRSLLGEVLQLGDRAANLEASTPLLGALPEFDSMAVASVLAALEEQFDIEVEDDELGAETFETVGALAQYVEAKIPPLASPRRAGVAEARSSRCFSTAPPAPSSRFTGHPTVPTRRRCFGCRPLPRR